MRNRLMRGWNGIAAIAAVAMATGCAGQPKSGMRSLVHGVAVSGPELRMEARMLAPKMIHMVERAADEASARSWRPAVRLRVLQFKTEAVPAMYSAMFQADPLASLADTWCLIAQMRGYFETGPGASLPEGPRRALLDGCGAMEAEMNRIDREIRPRSSPAKAQQYFRRWALEHPVTDFSTRDSGVAEYAKLMAQEGERPLALIGTMNDNISDINARINMLNANLPKQVGWQLELVVAQLLAGQPPFDAPIRYLRNALLVLALVALIIVVVMIRAARRRKA